MYSSLKILFILLVLSLNLSGCGDLVGKEVAKRELDGSQFEVQCELDMDKFADIVNENISSQINCLGENLNLFIRIVKSGKPGYLSRVQLEQYLAKHRPDVKPEMVKALKSVFDLGYLITGEDPDYISKETVDKVVNFALIFNQEAALNYGPIFQNESPVTFALHQNHRDRVSSANKAIIQALRTIFNPNRNGAVHKINIIKLLESFATETNRDSIEKARKVLFVKKVLFGGDSEILTHHELEKLILNFDHLLLIGLDIVRYKYIILKQESLLQLVKRDVNDLFDIITQGNLNNRDAETLFTVNDAIEAAKVFVKKEDFDVENFKNLIVEVKKIAMKGNATDVKGIELKNLFAHAKSLLQTGTVFHRIYDKFKAQLDSPRPVEETINFDEYRYTYPEHQTELNQFERITKKYRFMKGEFLSSFYTRGFKRNADAIFEIAMFEYALKLVFSTYGSPSPNEDAVGGFSIDKEQMQKLVSKFEPELVKLDLILPGRAISTADNISLLGTLFQYQSDKNKVMDVNEATEFGVSLISSLNISDDLYEYFKEQDCSLDQFDRLEPACVKKHFWRGFCSFYKGNYPLMFESMDAPKKCEDFQETTYTSQLLDKAITAARPCNFYTDGDKEEIHISKGDLMSILLALMHAETTVLRWDVNSNNYMDEGEVTAAYDIYSPALDGFLEGKSPIIKRFKKQIYQFMLKYEQVPDEKDFGSIWKFVKFLLSFDKRAPANRKTIVSILSVIGEENSKLQTGPPFDCNLMRDPENIPPVDYSTKKEPNRPIFISPDLGLTKSVVNEFNKELLRNDLLKMSEDIERGNVKKINDISPKYLRRLFKRISDDRVQMAVIGQIFPEGAELQKIALAISFVLTNE
jgi:hypothetical protein